jgi:hypothetical protein
LVASDRGRHDESAANAEEDNGWNAAWRVEITKNKKITTSIWLYLVIFTAIWLNFRIVPALVFHCVFLWGKASGELRIMG